MRRIYSTVCAMKFSMQYPVKMPFGKYFFAAVLLAAGLVVWVQLVLPSSAQVHCLFRRWSGIPCPACGGTRGIQQMLRGDFISAFRLQPLVFVSVLTAGAVVLYLSIAGLAGRPVVRIQLEHRRERIAAAVLLLLAILLNWVYVIVQSR